MQKHKLRFKVKETLLLVKVTNCIVGYEGNLALPDSPPILLICLVRQVPLSELSAASWLLQGWSVHGPRHQRHQGDG